MANCTDIKNPLQHNGTARSERLLEGMQEDYVKVDEKTFADWIVFAKEFSRYINFYELTAAENPGGNWSAFFSNDVSAVLGSIAVQDVDAYRREIKSRFDFLKDDDSETQLAGVKRKLNDLFSIITGFCESLDSYYRMIPVDTALKHLVENLIKVNLSSPLKNLLRYYEAAKGLNFLIADIPPGLKVLGNPVKDASLIVNGSGFDESWWKHFSTVATPLTSWTEYYATIISTKDESIFGSNVLGWSDYKKINHAANHNLFAAIFQQFLIAFSRLVGAAEKELLASVENKNDHAPHYALFLAFLRLFRLAQDNMNTITQRHLDFYYKEILQLKQRPALPNSAHIIVELAKPVDDHLLQKNSLFKAGKDSSGKEVLYTLNTETTFNKAVVKSLRSVYFGTTGDNILPGVTNAGRLFAAPVINSADGSGAALVSANKEWHPFANRLFREGNVTAVAMQKAEIGFAVASHYLYLQEGKRQIIFFVVTSDNDELVGKNYEVYVTTAKGWYRVESGIQVSKTGLGTDECVQFSFKLKGDEPALSNYYALKHGGTLNVNVPVMKVLLVNDDEYSYEYGNTADAGKLREVMASKIKIEVKVGMDYDADDNTGLKQLQVTTGAGPADVSKPFMPFGSPPAKDSSFIIGSKEIFSKKNSSLTLNIEWAGITGFTTSQIAYLTNAADIPDAKFDLLEQGRWHNNVAHVSIFNGANQGVTVFTAPNTIPDTAIADFKDEYKAYTADSANGFMRFVLNNGFGHAAHQLALSKYLIEQSKPSPRSSVADPDIPPYIPLIQSLTVSYSANSGIIDLTDADLPGKDFEQRQVCFFHIYPFGDAEQHAFLSQENSLFLLPQFNHKDGSKIIQHEGEFYIGLQHIKPQQSVNILFQVMDGTANPGVTKPDDHIHWSYLSNNQWKSFDKQKLSDGTMQLIQSGIIQFIVPADATMADTVMPAGYVWIKASVHENTDAVCKLISVEAQAAVVTFKDNSNAPGFLNTALPASSISKLKVPHAAVKKINQPYSSFGGRPAEASNEFYVRVSERLRHKARAITIWDYERLVLEAFPLIHKVKCLNHTNSSSSDHNEMVPGHVSIITIPDLKHRNDIDPLRPFTSQAVLNAIKIFLKKRISCHVQIHVINPVFEEVRLNFSLRLAKGFDDFTIYAVKLQEEITAFLSPWAYGRGDISFEGKIYKSVLINFIEERHYVDFITDVKMAHLDADGSEIKADNDEIVATTSKGILVSVPASKHNITPIPLSQTEPHYECDYLEQREG